MGKASMWSQAVACQTLVTRTRVLLTAIAAMTGTAIPAAVIQVCQGPREMGTIAGARGLTLALLCDLGPIVTSLRSSLLHDKVSMVRVEGADEGRFAESAEGGWGLSVSCASGPRLLW